MLNKCRSYSNRENGCVYIVKDDLDIIKVGGAFDLQKRIRQLKTKYNTNFFVIAEIHCKYFMQLEFFLHKRLKKYSIPFRKEREWYENENEITKNVLNFILYHGSVFEIQWVHIARYDM